MNTMLQNFLNGNLTDARRQAKRYSVLRICEVLFYRYDYRFGKASNIARYLKGNDSCLQAACAAE